MPEGYVKIEDLFIYKLSMELCDSGWSIYEKLDWRDKKIMGDQFITAVDSNAANIAEGYGRFHYLDRIKFYYNARASLIESKHWASLLQKRNKIFFQTYDNFIKQANHVHLELNKYIKTCYNSKHSTSKTVTM
jgi:four helix bundle protein